MATFVNEVDINYAIESDPEVDIKLPDSIDTSDNDSIDTSDKEDFPEVEDELEVDVSIFGEIEGLADVTLVVEDRRIPVVKAVLSLASPVFRAMFQSDFKEKNQEEIRLDGKKLDIFVTFLRCIYPDLEEEVTVENVYDIIYLANEYQVSRLLRSSEKVLLVEMEKFEDIEKENCCLEVYHHLAIADTCQLERLKAFCVSIASDACQADRDAAVEVHPVSSDIQRCIEKRVIRKQEIYLADYDALLGSLNHDSICDILKQKLQIVEKAPASFGTPIQNVQTHGGFTFTQVQQKQNKSSVLRGSPVSVSNAKGTTREADVQDLWKMHLRNLRWVYKHTPTDDKLKRQAIYWIRQAQQWFRWNIACAEEFSLLPEIAKHDIKGRYIMKY
ncbi:kelch-like protein 38 [Mya arenaria]|nr:kelch-like protein 38 [Mya arenaria]XP_052766581.1 kelch-like protein 38 [Mya arenaria]XP_052766583.1 kelch-like protein 38 [Mya arenaria]XP_052766584.1 kelch-like protein 38 [Mya arenaria]